MAAVPLDSGGPLVSAKEWAEEQIRGLIHTGELVADERVAIGVLAERLGISRTPVRDALWHLEREGLVTINPRVGVYVRRLTRVEAEDIFRLKVEIEPLMARWAAERGAASERSAYRDMVEDLRAAAAAGEPGRYIAGVETCRRRLAVLAGSSAAGDALGAIDGRVRLIRYRNLSRPGVPVISVREHVRIADAIARGDGDGAHRAMRKHMLAASARIIRVMDATGLGTSTAGAGQ